MHSGQRHLLRSESPGSGASAMTSTGQPGSERQLTFRPGCFGQNSSSIRFSLRMDILPENVLYYLWFKRLNGNGEFPGAPQAYCRFCTEICVLHRNSHRLGSRNQAASDSGDDAAYLTESFSARKIPGFTVDNQLAEKSLDWLIQCKNDPACMGVFVNHDPTVPEQELEVML